MLGVGGYLGYSKIKGFFTAADYDGPGTDPVQVEIAKDSSLTEIGNVLVDADVVKSTAAFTEAADANPKGKNIQSGTTTCARQMAAAQAVALMLDPKSRVVSGILIPPARPPGRRVEAAARAPASPSLAALPARPPQAPRISEATDECPRSGYTNRGTARRPPHTSRSRASCYRRHLRDSAREVDRPMT
ncbi:hypothetical protein GCM10020358_01760 [Amorphoplanes nipponensis]|uniref:hypothetical protein n=1 Tax=Actinoplanes nipponensis TaxID=135950 RepID=UPI0031EC66E1